MNSKILLKKDISSPSVIINKTLTLQGSIGQVVFQCLQPVLATSLFSISKSIFKCYCFQNIVFLTFLFSCQHCYYGNYIPKLYYANLNCNRNRALYLLLQFHKFQKISNSCRSNTPNYLQFNI